METRTVDLNETERATLTSLARPNLVIRFVEGMLGASRKTFNDDLESGTATEISGQIVSALMFEENADEGPKLAVQLSESFSLFLFGVWLYDDYTTVGLDAFFESPGVGIPDMLTVRYAPRSKLVFQARFQGSGRVPIKLEPGFRTSRGIGQIEELSMPVNAIARYYASE